MTVYRSSTTGNTAGMAIVDDGSNYDFSIGGTKYFSFRQSDGQLLLSAGVTSDQTL